MELEWSRRRIWNWNWELKRKLKPMILVALQLKSHNSTNPFSKVKLHLSVNFIFGHNFYYNLNRVIKLSIYSQLGNWTLICLSWVNELQLISNFIVPSHVVSQINKNTLLKSQLFFYATVDLKKMNIF